MTDPTDTPDRAAVVAIAKNVVAKHATAGRNIENWLALAGVLQAMLYGLAEFLIHIGLATPKSCGIPYMTITLFLGCVLPKTIGRATAGKVWEAIANRGKAQP